MANSIHPEPKPFNAPVANPRRRSKRRIVLYVLAYVLICAAAWAVTPLRAQSPVPHNGTMPVGPTMFLPVAVQRAVLGGTIPHNGTLPMPRLFLPVAVQRARLAQECLVDPQAVDEASSIWGSGQPC